MCATLETVRVDIPESWSRYLISTRGHYLRPLKIATTAAAQKAAAKAIDLDTLPTLEEAGRALNGKPSARAAQKKWIDWSVRERGLVTTLREVLELTPSSIQGYHGKPANDGFFLGLREHLAHAPDDEFEACLRLAGSHMRTDMRARLCYLFTNRNDWLLAELEEVKYWNLSWLLAAVTDIQAAEALFSRVHISAFTAEWCPNIFAHVLALFGLGAGPLLAPFAASAAHSSESARSLSRALACVPEPTAFTALLELADVQKSALEALQGATETFPVMALSAVCGDDKRETLCRTILAKNPGILPIAELSEEQNSWLGRHLPEAGEVESAPFELWPEVLREPRWKSPRNYKPKAVPLEPLSDSPKMGWEPGQRESWTSHTRVAEVDQNYFEYQQTLPTWQRGQHHVFSNLVTCPREAGLTMIENTEEFDPWYIHDHIRGVIARWELEALPLIRRACQAKTADIIPYISPYDDAELALLAAEAYARLKSVRKPALEYLLKYPRTASQVLIPLLLGKAKKQKEWAQNALSALSLQGLREIVESTAESYGEEALAQVRPLMEMDALDDLPKKMPELPPWCPPSVLAKPQLKEGGALVGEALENLLLMLAISLPEKPYAGVEMVTPACSEQSLAKFAWSLFQAWMDAGADSKYYWAFHALGWLGNDETVRLLTPLLKKWPGEGGHARAVQGLDVLTNIGSDLALMNLFGLSQKLKFKGLKNQAASKVKEIAEKRGLTADELGDRLVPDLGLSGDGSLKLDYGPRHFVVGFDEKLKPFVKDQEGKPRKSLPKPAKSDDQATAGASFERFKVLKKDVRAIAEQQLVRLEQAMVKQRRWRSEEFRTFFLEHPLVVNLARRLVWGVFEDDKLESSLRIAEDGTLSDIEDEEFVLRQGGLVGLLHPLEMSESQRTAWSELFADYQILQPFAQLSRDVYLPQPEELESRELLRFQGLRVETLRLLSLESKGWKRGMALDNGIVSWIQKELPGELYACLNFEEGLVIGDPTALPEQELQTVTLHREERGWSSDTEIKFERISMTDFSELVRDLEPLRATAL